MVNSARVRSKCSWYSVLEKSIFLKNLRKEKCNPRISSETYCQQSINSRPEKNAKRASTLPINQFKDNLSKSNSEGKNALDKIFECIHLERRDN